MAICPHCGREVPDDAIVCPYCGAQINPDYVVCGNCGRLIPADAKVCPYCGAELSDMARCPNCGREIPANSKSCPYCGFRFDKDHPLVRIEYKKTPQTSPLSMQHMAQIIKGKEKVLYQEHPSLAQWFFGVFLTIIFTPVIAYLFNWLGDFLTVTIILYVLFTIFLIIPSLLYHLSMTYIITDRRIIRIRKLFTISIKEIPIKEISYVHYIQRAIQRLANIGDIYIHSSGGKLKFYNAPKPDEAKNIIQSLHASSHP